MVFRRLVILIAALSCSSSLMGQDNVERVLELYRTELGLASEAGFDDPSSYQEISRFAETPQLREPNIQKALLANEILMWAIIEHPERLHALYLPEDQDLARQEIERFFQRILKEEIEAGRFQTPAVTNHRARFLEIVSKEYGRDLTQEEKDRFIDIHARVLAIAANHSSETIEAVVRMLPPEELQFLEGRKLVPVGPKDVRNQYWNGWYSPTHESATSSKAEPKQSLPAEISGEAERAAQQYIKNTSQTSLELVSTQYPQVEKQFYRPSYSTFKGNREFWQVHIISLVRRGVGKDIFESLDLSGTNTVRDLRKIFMLAIQTYQSSDILLRGQIAEWLEIAQRHHNSKFSNQQLLELTQAFLELQRSLLTGNALGVKDRNKSFDFISESNLDLVNRYLRYTPEFQSVYLGDIWPIRYENSDTPIEDVRFLSNSTFSFERVIKNVRPHLMIDDFYQEIVATGEPRLMGRSGTYYSGSVVRDVVEDLLDRPTNNSRDWLTRLRLQDYDLDEEQVRTLYNRIVYQVAGIPYRQFTCVAAIRDLSDRLTEGRSRPPAGTFAPR